MESFRSQQCRRRSRLHSKRSLRVVKPFLTHFSNLGSFLFFGEILAWPFFGKPFFGTRKYCSGGLNWACAHDVMVSKVQWKPFWPTIQLYPQNDSPGWQICVNCDVFTHQQEWKQQPLPRPGFEHRVDFFITMDTQHHHNRRNFRT